MRCRRAAAAVLAVLTAWVPAAVVSAKPSAASGSSFFRLLGTHAPRSTEAVGAGSGGLPARPLPTPGAAVPKQGLFGTRATALAATPSTSAGHRFESLGQAAEKFRSTAAWQGLTEQGDVAAYGAQMAGEPPDSQVAVGPTSLVEMVNTAGAVYNRDGTLVMQFDLASLFQPAPGYILTDPRVLFDQPTQRFIAAALSFTTDAAGNVTGSQLLLAVSTSSDPTQPWTGWAGPAEADVSDQPRLGVADNVVVVGWNEYQNDVSGGTLLGGMFDVIDKNDLVTGSSSLHDHEFGPSPQFSGVAPAQALSASPAEWAVINNELAGTQPQASITVLRMTGSPATGNLTVTPFVVGFSGTDPMPPPAAQPSGAPIDAGDSRFQNAVWRDGQLWTAATDGCVETTTNTASDCAEVVGLSTATSSPSLISDFDLVDRGIDYYYPAVTLDAADVVYVAMNGSSSSVAPAALVVAQRHAATAVAAVDEYADSSTGYTGDRWGDYSGIAVDPQNPQTVFTAVETAAGSGTWNWGTALTGFGLNSPTVRSTTSACPPGSVPASSFSDVPPQSYAYSDISCAVWWQVARGTSSTTYTPAANVPRDQMAAFIARLILRSGGSLPANPPDAFSDTASDPFRLQINQLAAAGIVQGTGGGKYSPGAPVSRGAMTAFLDRAYTQRQGQGLTNTGDYFDDTTGSVFRPNINDTASVGIIGGFADGTYRPDATVTREQMASYLVRELDVLTAAGATVPPGS